MVLASWESKMRVSVLQSICWDGVKWILSVTFCISGITNEDFLNICHRTIYKIGIFSTLLLSDDISTHIAYLPLYYHPIYRMLNMSPATQICIHMHINMFSSTIGNGWYVLLITKSAYCLSFLSQTILNENTGQKIWNGVII